MDTGAPRWASSAVLCRDCYNYKGMRSGQERRRAGQRLCAAGVDLNARADVFMCDSYIPLTIDRGTGGCGESSASGSSLM